MNKSTLRNLSIVLFALVAILIALEVGERDTDVSSGELLFEGLKAQINDVRRVTVERPGTDGATDVVTISNETGTWSVAARANYPASIATLRELLIALADARVLEEKTADPERYEQLGVRDPAVSGSKGVKITIAGEDFAYSLILGNAHQGANRYARIADQLTSVLIDKNPSLPDSAGGWLRDDLVDIDAADVRSAVIRHADGETIRIVKDSREDGDFRVPDLPDGRELSYPTVANSVGGALNDLKLEDVRRAEAGEPTSTAELETFDGLRIVVETTEVDGDTWIALDAAVADSPPSQTASEETAGEAATEPSADADAAQGEVPPDPAAAAAAINERLRGWQFKIPSYKANQLTRRWDDILKADTDTE